MHYKTKQKLKLVTKIYLNEPEDDKTTEVRLQLPDKTYIHLFLNHPFPKSVSYMSLAYGGFNYDPSKDVRIYHQAPNDAVEILKKSIDYRNNDTNTINKLIDLIESFEISKHYF